MKKYLAEFTGTFALVFFGTGSIIINDQTGFFGNTGIAFTFGLIVMAMIYSFRNISGAHFNPAVTIGFSLAKLFTPKEILPYILFQILGAFVASFLLKLLFPANLNLGSTIPAGSQIQSFILEIVLTLILMLVILVTSQGIWTIKQFAGILIGLTILLESMFAGPICGASMNPARSLAPAIVSGNIQSLWIYLVAPPLGASLAVSLWKLLKD